MSNPAKGAEMQLITIETMDELLKTAFKIPYGRGIKTFWPNAIGDKIKILKVPFKAHLVNCYCVFSNIMSFRNKEGVFVIPHCHYIEALVRNNGYRRAPLYVPFSHGDYPIDGKLRWFNLMK